MICPNEIGEFQVTFPSPPAESIFNTHGKSGTFNAVAAGRYVWTIPLSSGTHTVKYRGRLHVEHILRKDHSKDITYNIGRKWL